ncbi:DegT/DnrJ/EryC1/StrS family aminotransferase [Haliangium sp.]|uniref:DegT/DnrJ/EryC1/StrS family aminotransferase n=1 Tax=Haliangium sp. TaxID=2663208 RepID=UPI003D126C01
MDIPLVDLKAQYREIRGEIDAAIRRVVDSAWFVGGDEVAGFERELAAYCEVAEAVACGSGTDALALALRGLGVGPGDEVVTVAHTFIATVAAIAAVGARPVFVDVCADTLVMDPDHLDEVVTARTRAIVPVHLYGQVADMDPIREVAARRGLAVLEDAAQAHGARYRGRRAGSLGVAAGLSFYPGKNLGAYGDAGAVVTGDAALAARVRRLRDHGRVGKYEHAELAGNSRMDAIQAAVLRVKLAHLEVWNQRRRALAAAYDAALAEVAEVRPVATGPAREHVYHLYVVRTPRRDHVLHRLRRAGVGAGIHYPIPCHRQAPVQALVGEVSLPVTEAAAAEILSLPIYPELPPEAPAHIARIVADALP